MSMMTPHLFCKKHSFYSGYSCELKHSPCLLKNARQTSKEEMRPSRVRLRVLS